MEPLALESLSPYISMHMLITQIRGQTRPVSQFEGKVVLDSKFDLKSDIHHVVCVSLALQHPLDVPHVHHDPLLNS
jgi:hypothetical protein